MKYYIAVIGFLFIACCLSGCVTNNYYTNTTTVPAVTPTPVTAYVYVTPTPTPIPTLVQTLQYYYHTYEYPVEVHYPEYDVYHYQYTYIPSPDSQNCVDICYGTYGKEYLNCMRACQDWWIRKNEVERNPHIHIEAFHYP